MLGATYKGLSKNLTHSLTSRRVDISWVILPIWSGRKTIFPAIEIFSEDQNMWPLIKVRVTDKGQILLQLIPKKWNEL